MYLGKKGDNHPPILGQRDVSLDQLVEGIFPKRVRVADTRGKLFPVLSFKANSLTIATRVLITLLQLGEGISNLPRELREGDDSIILNISIDYASRSR